MLQLKNISKEYATGDFVQAALDDVSVNLRANEFVSVLGPSGSGKTTLLNIIGGLDRYDKGDLIINHRSTKKYKDRDWDSYRNYSIGFIFQSFNLIPHQTVLANVELALTISSVSASEIKNRAVKALQDVGLGDHLHKKPNQLSGGQMQRVAIARALINNPDILLADEPTGSLDTETGIQVMELLKEVAKDRLVIMVTHNAELAKLYSTRIIQLQDGKMISDSNPYIIEESKPKQKVKKKIEKTSMSFLTSLSLSFNNLLMKKGRTFLTAFAGSIGIIGVALILALSNGVNSYIENIQQDTMSSYPIDIGSQTFDLTSMRSQGRDNFGTLMGKAIEKTNDGKAIYSDHNLVETSETAASNIISNNLAAFKKDLDDPDSEIQNYLGENGIKYQYDVPFDVYSYNSTNSLINTNTDPAQLSNLGDINGSNSSRINPLEMLLGSRESEAENFQELMDNPNGQAVNDIVSDNYEMLYGNWPEKYNEVILVLNENNSLSPKTLYQLGLITADEYLDVIETLENDKVIEEFKWDYPDILEHEFYLVPSYERYEETDKDTFVYIEDETTEMNQLLKEKSINLKITGVIRPIEGADNKTISTAVAYTSKLVDHILENSNISEIILAQENSPEVNVLTGIEFDIESDHEKIETAKKFISDMGISDKAAMYEIVMYSQSQNPDLSSSDQVSQENLADSDQENMPDRKQEDVPGVEQEMDESMKAEAMEQWLEKSPDDKLLLGIYSDYIDQASYDDNMIKFGKIDKDTPSSINIYTDSFEDKDGISLYIENYNKKVAEDNKIFYTDYVALMTSSISTIINVISYVLIAFVAVSLVVSSIMIGIITYISVVERTKEIGVLRALGASRRNISQVFNAETIIVGLAAGILGVGLAYFLTLPINNIIHKLVGDTSINAELTIQMAIVLIALSMILTLIGGLIPARKAAKKDPVIALRTE